MIKILLRCFLAAWLLLFASATWNLLAEPKGNGKQKTTTESAGAVSNDSYMGLTGEELWSNNCLRCHNIRPPTMYNNAQWDVRFITCVCGPTSPARNSVLSLSS
jgi:cytochrome c5